MFMLFAVAASLGWRCAAVSGYFVPNLALPAASDDDPSSGVYIFVSFLRSVPGCPCQRFEHRAAEIKLLTQFALALEQKPLVIPPNTTNQTHGDSGGGTK